MDHAQLRNSAKASLAGAWLMMAVGTLIYSVITGAASFVYIGQFILYGPLTYGYVKFITLQADNNNQDFAELFTAFQSGDRFVQTMIAGIIYMVVVGVGLVLLIVPGIILACGLSMTFFIMAEDPNISGADALKKSWDMMNGYKMDFFIFILGFIGWILLSAITCGIGFLFLNPYMTTSQLLYYRKISNALPPVYK